MSRARQVLAAPRHRAQRLRHQLRPGGIYERHAARARRAGIDGLKLIVSFDCDTADDIATAGEVHRRMLELGVQSVYAVPGELLRRGAAEYVAIHESGSEFLNHGGREHTYFDEDLGRHASCFFYDQIGPEGVREDVRLGHALVEEVLGAPPAGFRTPHFGTYQRPAELGFLHSMLAEIGYRFSTSTVPAWGLRHGPVVKSFALPEIPVTGAPSAPLEILDTWSCFAAPDRVKGPGDFLDESELLASRFATAGAGVINVYGDPSHVHGEDAFFDAIEVLRRVADPSGYADLLSLIR